MPCRFGIPARPNERVIVSGGIALLNKSAYFVNVESPALAVIAEGAKFAKMSEVSTQANVVEQRAPVF
jgi:hypothetical protein